MENKIDEEMYLVKRDGTRELIDIEKMVSRVESLCYGLDQEYVKPTDVVTQVLRGVYDGVKVTDLVTLQAETAATMTVDHSDYALLAGRIVMTNLHKETKSKFSDVIDDLYAMEKGGKRIPMISEYCHKIIAENADRLNAAVVAERDFTYHFFAIKTLERSYLMKINDRIVERPQYMLMRTAVGIHGEDIDAAIETYSLMSQKYFTHASPTMFSAATPRPQLSSCFLLSMTEDSMEGIYETLSRCARISRYAGGIGLNVHNIRAKGTEVGLDGASNGLVPMLSVFNKTARHVWQGGNKRPGSFAIYLEPWHADIFDFLNLRKNTGNEEERCRDLFYGLWVPDLFMKRVESDDVWSLMCPHESPGLFDVWGDEFETLYVQYEKEKSFVRQVKARDLWFQIIQSQVETGTPYLLYKDACNRKSNQQNLGTIRSSNLCTEIVEYTSPDEIAVCNLASIAVNMFVTADQSFDFTKLKDVTKIVARNLNKIIDVNFYPLPQAEKSNKRHRPIGIGIQGLADAFILMRYPYESPEAVKLNQQIFETIYYGALEASYELAALHEPYETYQGSPVSKSILQYDMWNKTPTDLWDWAALKKQIVTHGVRNSLLLAPMPTAATAQILGNNESFEPYTSNIYNRRVLSGDFQVVNHHLVKDLTEIDMWDDDMKNEIIADYGSIQAITRIPQKIRDLYKTVWEISVKTSINMAADRGAFIDQSQSFNIHVAEPTYAKMSSIHFYGWKAGLKTGMYYLRTRPAANPIQFTVDKKRLALSRAKNSNRNSKSDSESTDSGKSTDDDAQATDTDDSGSAHDLEREMAALVCSRENKEDCVMCGA